MIKSSDMPHRFSDAKLHLIRIAWIVAIGFFFYCYSVLYLVGRATPTGVLFLDQFGPGYRVLWVFSAGACACLVLSIWLRRRILYLRQERNERVAAELLQDLLAGEALPVKNFFVYLRSFETTGKLRPPFFFTLFVFERLHTNELESFLASALEKQGPLVALGRPEENFGAARIAVQEESWKPDIESLVEGAAGVLVIPSAREGTEWEINFLKEQNLLSKCVFIMPPKTRQFDWRAKWEQAAQDLKEYSISLPPYNDRGLLFTLDANGGVAQARVFSLLWRRSLRKSILKLLSGAQTRVTTDQAVKRALRRSRLLWLWGRWGTSASTLIGLLYFLWIVFGRPLAGFAPRGIDPAPSWSTFLTRYNTVDAIENFQGQLNNNVFLYLHRTLSESQIDQLAAKGLTRISDPDREAYLVYRGELLSHSRDANVCAALANGRASEIDRTRTMLTMPVADLTAWMWARQEAVMAEVRSPPVEVREEQIPAELDQALSTVLGEPSRRRMQVLLTARNRQSARDTCWSEITAAVAVNGLKEPWRSQWAKIFAIHGASGTNSF